MSDTTVTTGRRSPKLTPEQRARKQRIQIITGVILVIAVILFGFYIQGQNPKGAFIWAIGLAFGYVLQRSRFCFTAAMRDPLLTGGTSLTKALIVALALASLVFAGLHMSATGWDISALDLSKVKLPGYIQDAGVHTIIGGLLFGIGAVIAGGCASGTFMRMGEGFAQQWITLIFFMAGSIIGGFLIPAFKATGFLYTPVKVYLPKLFGGWIPALIVQFGVLFVLYILADWYGKKKSGEL